MKDNICPKPIQRLLSHSRDLLIVFDNNGKEIYISDTLQKLLGYPVSEIAEKSFMHIIHPADKANLQARLHKLKIEKDASIFTELIIKHKNGQNLVFAGIAINETDETDETHNNHIYLFLRNISSIKKLENELQETYLKQKEIKKYGVEAREKERKTFAAFLHDEIGQALTAIKICLGRISANIESRSDTLAGIDKMIKLINNTIEETQHINYELRPNLTDKLGFAPAIRTYCNDWKERTGINVKLLIDSLIINNNAALALFRIIQEALTNVARHSNACTVNINLLQSKEAIQLLIEDDGIGIPKNKINHIYSFGITGMMERADMLNGSLIISGDKGTKIEVIIPFYK